MKSLVNLFFIFLIANLLMPFTGAFSQGVAINETGDAADNSAMLDISSTYKGLLIPRMTADQRDLISDPADGLLIYVNDDSTFYVYAKSGWVPLLSSAGPYIDWNVSEDTLYSLPDSTVTIKDSKVGIGIISPSYLLDVNGSFRANTVNTGQGNYEVYQMNQDVTTTCCPTFTSVNTGQGNNELYAMNQDVTTTSSPTFAAVNTGQGNNELYAMNQDVTTTSSPTFATVNTGQGNYELYQMNQNVTTTSSPTFATVNTGLGNNELYTMDQNVATTSNPTFNIVNLSDYGTALGGFHVGGTSDPGTDNLVVDGSSTLTGGLSTGESASGETTRFGTQAVFGADVNPIVTCRSGYFWWDYDEKKVKFTETNAHNGYARFSGQKNEGSGATLFDGIASYESTAVVATIDSNLEYCTVEVTSEGADGGYVHLYCMFSNGTFVAHYWFRYQ